MQTAPGREAISKAYHVPIEHLEKRNNSGFTDITDDVMKIWYNDNADDNDSIYAGNMSDIFKRL